jgi:Domain of unknown function (DUF397)
MGNWRKSTYSDANGGDCVELAGDSRLVMIRDTTNRGAGTLTFTADTWRAFLDRLEE